MNTAVMYSSKTDEWETPRLLFERLDREFYFSVDAAATADNAKCATWYGATLDALALDRWAAPPAAIWLNPPYSECRAFMAKAAAEARKGCTVVCLVPSRTDTSWWHDYVWDTEQHRPRPGVEVRFIRGRIKFGEATSGAPFPSVLVVFRPAEDSHV